MRKFVKEVRRSEAGLTLIELIASLTVLSMVSIAIYGVIHFGFNTYHRVTIENSLRDEGDLIMSTVIAQLYEIGPESIKQLPDGIELTSGTENRTLKIENGQLHILRKDGTDQRISTDSSVGPVESGTEEFHVSCQAGTNECASGLIEVSIKLSQSYAGQVHDLALKSRFGF